MFTSLLTFGGFIRTLFFHSTNKKHWGGSSRVENSPVYTCPPLPIPTQPPLFSFPISSAVGLFSGVLAQELEDHFSSSFCMFPASNLSSNPFTVCFFFFFLAILCCLRDLSSLTRDQTLGSESAESYPLDHQGIPSFHLLTEAASIHVMVPAPIT